MQHLLQEAVNEIESLRRRNELLSAQMEVVEVFRVALMGQPRSSGASIDVAWSLRKKIAELETAKA